MANTEDQLIQRLKFTPLEVYDFLSEWWSVQVDAVNSGLWNDYPDRAACDSFLSQYGWNLVELFTVLDVDMDDMVK